MRCAAAPLALLMLPPRAPQARRVRMDASADLTTAMIRREHPNIAERPSSAPQLPPLRNRYIGVRHGQSTANVEMIISSDFMRGCTDHGLTPDGVAQARAAADGLVRLLPPERLERNMIVLSSPFARARETAAEVLSALRAEHGLSEKVFLIEPLLRERWFGELDGTSLAPPSNYNKVWPLDWLDAQNDDCGVESVEEVCGRVATLLAKLEAAHSGRDIVLVSHADTLQIAQTVLCGADPRRFSQYRFANGEARDMLELPEPAPLPFP